jgi:hypothetical protein
LTIGAYLLDTLDVALPRAYQAVDKQASAREAPQVGADLTDVPAFLRSTGSSREATSPANTQKRREELRVGMLVMGDGSAKRTTAAPGYFDERAEPFDQAVAAALERINLASLFALDQALADDLWVDGRVAWQAAAGAMAAAHRNDKSASWSAKLRYHEAPFGVGYLVANWSRRSGSYPEHSLY